MFIVYDLLDKGGLLIWPIFFCSILGTTIFFERMQKFRKVKKYRENLDHVFQMIHDGKFDILQSRLQKRQTKYGIENRIILEALNLEDPERDTLEMVLVHGIEREISSLSRFVDTLAVLASTTPLLGLLGTVVGMIKAFMVVETMGGRVNAAVLAGGIWEAMLTTALGLLVAIPLLFFHNHIENRIHSVQLGLEDVAISYMKAWSKGHNHS
jgi:biopolymer transport protein ExbB